jgi:hypothetical protein
VDVTSAALTGDNMIGGATASATYGRRLRLSGGAEGKHRLATAGPPTPSSLSGSGFAAVSLSRDAAPA